MGLYENMKTSPKLESEGIWLDLDHTRIKLGRAGGKNSKYVQALEKIMREYKRGIDQLSNDQSTKLFAKLYAETIVFDWLTKDESGDLDELGHAFSVDGLRYKRGISGPDGDIIEPTVVNITQTLLDIPDLQLMIKQTVEDATLYRAALVEGIAGN